jgi:uncharacterized lipoprotein YddW (UPF0748 family)
MSRYLIIIILLIMVCPALTAAEPTPLVREFRGVWVATVANIDWPSKRGLPAAKQKAELIAILDQAVELKLNAIVFQVRPMADALYESKLEPWSEYLTGKLGESPGYDPLVFAIQEAHARGLELHAWFNPYRARHPSAQSPAPPNHITRRRPDLAKPYGTHSWMNPTHPEVQEHSLAVILDVVKRYDVDGIHIDDYFYPYKEKDSAGQVIPFPDDDTWEKYQKTGGRLNRDDWRRDAVNTFVRRMYEQTKATKPWVKVGISPFGIWRPGNPPGIAGLDQYAELYADAKLWFNQGWVDYLTPQLYWPIAREKQSFPKLLDWWARENSKGRHLWPGLYTSKASDDKNGWSAKEIANQIELTRKQQGASGAIHFSMKALMQNSAGIADQLKQSYAEPALVPETPWLATEKPPVSPQITYVKMNDNKSALRVQAPRGTRFIVIRTFENNRWATQVVGVAEDGLATIPSPGTGPIHISVLDRIGRESQSVEVGR